MATARTGIGMEFESQGTLRSGYAWRGCAGCPKPGLSRNALVSLLMCFPVACAMWAAIIYSAVRLAR
jgi:hypothetical protein